MVARSGGGPRQPTLWGGLWLRALLLAADQNPSGGSPSRVERTCSGTCLPTPSLLMGQGAEWGLVLSPLRRPTPINMRLRNMPGVRGHFITSRTVKFTSRQSPVHLLEPSVPGRPRPWLCRCAVCAEAALRTPAMGTDAPHPVLSPAPHCHTAKLTSMTSAGTSSSTWPMWAPSLMVALSRSGLTGCWTSSRPGG